ncbi:MAG: glycoside hydrolase N-terminal domain-containing protein [Verrucomicrobia bacterium]|nr:glycoside hydrolase N-terminal domain-containing protein [Verrucomicrobiota bacterium]
MKATESNQGIPRTPGAREKGVKRFSPFFRAHRHPLVYDKPAPDFFEGALLGNGGLGVVVCTRPDAVVLRFGHNNVWDIRIAEDNREKIGTFQQVFERVKAIPATYQSLTEDPWYAEYLIMARENYAKPYPRPLPCGSLIVSFDRRRAELLGHRVNIATGLCEILFITNGQENRLQIFVEMDADRVWLWMADSPFDRIRLLPDPEMPKELPAYTVAPDALGFRQALPAGNDPAKDRAFRLMAQVNSPLEARTRTNTVSGIPETMGDLERGIVTPGGFIASVQLWEGLASEVPVGGDDRRGPDDDPTDDGQRPPRHQQFEEALRRSQKSWRKFWSRSGVALDDPVLERTWYQNLYFLNCSVKPGVTCPGLFANWSYRNIGTAWHGDYHLDYNAQQPFWVTFSSNHADKHLAYVGMIDHLLPSCRAWAKDYYGMRGAYFPVSAYPVEMTMSPYPLPSWGWQVCSTPWAVQSLWWHYLYTQDKKFLEERAIGPLREAVLFLVDYLKRSEAHGPQWGDDKYHIFPTVPSELYKLRPGFKFNRDCLIDLTLTRFVFRAFLEACCILGRDEPVIADVHEVLAHFPDYPTAGDVFVSAPDENPEIVYNVPASLMTIFPGEDPTVDFKIAANTYRNHRNEGGNELVFLNFIGARLGLLDLEKFKRQIEYCRLPNGTCTDRILQVHGRYTDTSDFDFMSRMGIWFENFALPAVINECLMQSVGGVIRFFPNWPIGKSARFHTLRAVGAFLVSAATTMKGVEWVEIRSEAGSTLRVINPWTGELVERETKPGEVIRLMPARCSETRLESSTTAGR